MPELNILTPVIVPSQQVRFGEKRYALSMVFEPVRRTDGTVLSRLRCCRAWQAWIHRETCCPRKHFTRAAASQLRTALRAQVNCLQACLPWFQAKGVLATLNINRPLATLLLRDLWVRESLRDMQPWLRFEISEYFLNGSTDDEPLLDALNALAPLWLDDFGTGSTSLSALMARRFEVIKLERTMFTTLAVTEDGQALLASMNRFAHRYGAGCWQKGGNEGAVCAGVPCRYVGGPGLALARREYRRTGDSTGTGDRC
ncbi:EAL domain-containing protein [Citrobacter koseri]|uniref:EAL domain-containing protein n=1 Tax=Citrobacter koseri TaxID=545 RepID=UPI00388D7AE6